LRVLHLTPELPFWPGGSGGSARQFQLLRHAVERGHEVHVVAPVTREQRPSASVLEEAGIAASLYARPGSRVAETARAVAREPRLAGAIAVRPVFAWQVSVFWQAIRPLVRPLLSEWRPDVVAVEHDHAAAWLADLGDRVPAVLTLQNLGWTYYESRAAAATGPMRALLSAEARRFRRFDRRHLPRYDRLIAVSAAEANALAWTGRPVDLVPNGVSTEDFTAPPEQSGAPTLVFSGSMAYPPNEEGIAWFVREALPAIRAQAPDVELLIVGRDPPAAVRALAEPPAITVTGAVPDIRPHLARATVIVVPIRSGGGTRLKLLEAMAAGRAVVTTTAGAAGIDVTEGREVLVADDPGRFAEAVVELLRDAGARRRLAAAARAVAESRYDWRVVGDRYVEALERAREAQSLGQSRRATT
jgi:glycosyltransferase involved in cell wall biosynthesis